MMEKLIKKLNNRKGFTLIELIVVIAIIGILAAILIPQFGGFTDKAKKTQAVVDAKQVATAIDSIYAEVSAYPTANASVTAITTTLPGVISLDSDNDGGFTYSVSNGSITYSAGRTAAGQPVKAN